MMPRPTTCPYIPQVGLCSLPFQSRELLGAHTIRKSYMAKNADEDLCFAALAAFFTASPLDLRFLPKRSLPMAAEAKELKALEFQA